MLRRIELFLPLIPSPFEGEGQWVVVDYPPPPEEGIPVRWAWLGLAHHRAGLKLLWGLDVPEANIAQEALTDERLRFFWTERGWNRYGIKISAALSRRNRLRLLPGPFRVLVVERQCLELVYEDEFQAIAIWKEVMS